ncbi:MAG: hypothetical protein ACT4O1_16010 [Gemmatimonadota bacterium]
MAIETIHSFLTHASRGVDPQPEIGGTAIALAGDLFEMLQDVYVRAPNECDIEIMFQPDERGRQNNVSRDLILGYTRGPSIPAGRAIADRLQQVTTRRSGMGLLFLIKGKEGREHRLVIARFPADSGIVAEERARTLTVEFIERVFMRNAKAYKSALYKTTALAAGFWEGQAVDRQISGPQELSQYWIGDFLLSDLRTTGPAGTKRLAVALRTAIRTVEDLTVRRELISASDMIKNQDGRAVSANGILRTLRISEPAIAALRSQFPRPELMDERFILDREEFERHAPYRMVELDNGGVLIADDARFNEVFQRQELRVAENRVRYITEGIIVDERLRKTK